MAAKVGPKIALIYDDNHNDPNEKMTTGKLMDIDQKDFVVFTENRFFEIISKNQYSLELLGDDSTTSTATSCNLLIANILFNAQLQTTQVPGRILSHLLKTIYKDAYFKRLFTEKYYEKYNPKNYGLEKESIWTPLVAGNLTEPQNKAIQYVRDLFQRLDEQLPKKKSVKEKENAFDDQVDPAADALNNPTGPYQPDVFIPISHALAYIKIKKVHSNLAANADKSKELHLSMINHNPGITALNTQYRTQFQVQKVIKIVEKIFKEAPNTIFVIRNGADHSDIMTRQLKEHFTNGDIREIQLKREELLFAEILIRAQFSKET